MAQERFVVIVDQLNWHSKPGDRTTETGRVALKGQSFPVIEKKTVEANGLRMDWVRVIAYEGPWLAVKNYRTGVEFGRFESVSAPKPPPKIIVQDGDNQVRPILLVLGGVVIAALAVLGWCSQP